VVGDQIPNTDMMNSFLERTELTVRAYSTIQDIINSFRERFDNVRYEILEKQTASFHELERQIDEINANIKTIKEDLTEKLGKVSDHNSETLQRTEDRVIKGVTEKVQNLLYSKMQETLNKIDNDNKLNMNSISGDVRDINNKISSVSGRQKTIQEGLTSLVGMMTEIKKLYQVLTIGISIVGCLLGSFEFLVSIGIMNGLGGG